MGLLSDKESAALAPASEADSPNPVPVRVVSSDEFLCRYDIKKAAWRGDRFAALKSEYERQGPDPSHRRYGFVAPT